MNNVILDKPAKRAYAKRKSHINKENRIVMPHNLAISIDMIEDTISMAEEKITIFKLEQQQLKDPIDHATTEFKQAESMMLETKSELDKLQSVYDLIQEKINTKRALIALHNCIKSGKPIEKAIVYDKISNNVGVKVKERSKKINWINLAVSTLTKFGHFMDPASIISESLKQNKEVRYEFEKQKKHDYSKRTQLAKNILASAKLPKTSRRPKYLGFYENKIGLISWFDGNSIKPEFISNFIGTEQSPNILNSRFNKYNSLV